MPRVGQTKVVSVPTPPSLGTLRSYGLTADEWLEMARRQDYACPVCQKPFGDRKLVVDHEHVAGWRARKGKLKSGKRRAAKDQRVMTPDQRKVYVRGLLHAWCNGYVRAWLTLERAESIVAYLKRYHESKSCPASDRRSASTSVTSASGGRVPGATSVKGVVKSSTSAGRSLVTSSSSGRPRGRART